MNANEGCRNTKSANNSASLQDCLEKKPRPRRRTNSVGKVDMPNDKTYWARVNRYRRNVKTFGKYPKEVPRGVAKLPNLGKQPEKEPIEKELPYCPPPAKATQSSPKRSKPPLQVGTRGFVSDAEHVFRHWCDRLLDEEGKCEYCGTSKNLTCVPHPGVSMDIASMETICVICPDCIQDNLILLR